MTLKEILLKAESINYPVYLYMSTFPSLDIDLNIDDIIALSNIFFLKCVDLVPKLTEK